MRTSARFAALAAVTAIGFGAIATGTAEAGAQAARSTHVRLHNGTGCTLTRTDFGLDHGIWSQGQEPPYQLGNTGDADFQSESNGFMTGTEGHVTFQTSNCEEGFRNGRTVRLHWDNPFSGSNKYDTNGTDNTFRTTRDGGGGDNAYTVWGIYKN